MVFVLVLAYHLLLLGALGLASGVLSVAEIAIMLVLIGLGAAALIQTELLIEPRRRRDNTRGRTI